MNQMRIYLLQEEPFLTYTMPAADLAEYEEERTFYQSLVHKKRRQEQAQQANHTNRTRSQTVFGRFLKWFQHKSKSNDIMPEVAEPPLTEMEQILAFYYMF